MNIVTRSVAVVLTAAAFGQRVVTISPSTADDHEVAPPCVRGR
ncbi:MULTISPECIES: hypothetical protein [unclassified Pseudonocardia]|nr:MULTISPECIES: hypothetical protein [unclassified Pseudonocardia]